MSILPEPTLLELKDYEYYRSAPKFVVKYREFTLRDDRKHTKEIKHYGLFLNEKEARDHFFSLPKYYRWKTVHHCREFIKVVALKEVQPKKKKTEQGSTDHLNKRDPLVKQLIKDRFGK